MDARTSDYIISQLGFELGWWLAHWNERQGTMTIKGVEYLGDLMRKETERAQGRINTATDKAKSAFGKFHGAVDGVDHVVDHVEAQAKEVEKLASDLTAQLGNSPPDSASASDNPTQPAS